MSLDRIFTDQYIHLYHKSSYPDIITVFLSAICTAYVFVVIVVAGGEVGAEAVTG